MSSVLASATVMVSTSVVERSAANPMEIGESIWVWIIATGLVLAMQTDLSLVDNRVKIS